MRFRQIDPTPTAIDRYKVESDSGKEYCIYVGHDHTETCCCPDYLYRRRQLKQKCKHLIAFQNFKKHQEEQDAIIASVDIYS